MVTLLHASDLQIGKPFRPEVADALVRTCRERSPDVVVIAGDLTQRAKVGEYREARALLERFSPLPVVVTPGNHDVPLYRVWERLFVPFRNWRRFVSPEIDSVTSVPGATVVALSSAAPRRSIVGGRLTARQLDFARGAFEEAPEHQARILVTHHHFVRTEDGTGGRPLPGARDSLSALADMGVDLVLGGHIHRTRVVDPGDPRAYGAPFPLVSCGTTTSGRGRGPERDENTLNVVTVDELGIRVESLRHVRSSGVFERFDLRLLGRRRRPATEVE